MSKCNRKPCKCLQCLQNSTQPHPAIEALVIGQVGGYWWPPGKSCTSIKFEVLCVAVPVGRSKGRGSGSMGTG